MTDTPVTVTGKIIRIGRLHSTHGNPRFRIQLLCRTVTQPDLLLHTYDTAPDTGCAYGITACAHEGRRVVLTLDQHSQIIDYELKGDVDV